MVETVVCEGEGTHGDPCRLVTYYHSLDGEPLAVRDDTIRGAFGLGADGLFPQERSPHPSPGEQSR